MDPLSVDDCDQSAGRHLGICRHPHSADYTRHLGTGSDHRPYVGSVDPADRGDRTVDLTTDLRQRLLDGMIGRPDHLVRHEHFPCGGHR